MVEWLEKCLVETFNTLLVKKLKKSRLESVSIEADNDRTHKNSSMAFSETPQDNPVLGIFEITVGRLKEDANVERSIDFVAD